MFKMSKGYFDKVRIMSILRTLLILKGFNKGVKKNINFIRTFELALYEL